MDPDNSATAYASLYNHGIYKTSNGGDSWQLTGFPQGQSHAVITDQLSDSIVYACSGGFPVLRSRDGGMVYQDYGVGYPENSVYRFGYDGRVWQPRLYACGLQGLYCLNLDPQGLPDTLDLSFACTPETLTLPDTVLLDFSLTNSCHLPRSYGMTIDLELPGGTTYLAYRQGSVVLVPGQVFSTGAPIDFPQFGTLVGLTTFFLTGTDSTPPSSDGGLPSGYGEMVSCQVIASMP